MATVRDLLQTSPRETEALLETLANASAPRDRERRLAELRRAVEAQLGLEERHLLPALEAHEETEALVSGLLDANRRTRTLLAEARGRTEDDEAFAAKLAELRRVFHGRIRDDRNELLPAVAKALSGAEVSAIASEIQGDKTRTETRREGAKAPRAGAKRERADTASPDSNAGIATVRTGREDAGTGGDAVSRTPRAAPSRPAVEPTVSDDRGSEEGAGRAPVMAGGPRRTSMAGSFGDGSDGQAAAPAGIDRPASQDTAVIGGVLTALMGEQADHAMRTAAAIGRSRTLLEMAAAQTDFVGGSTQRMIRANECCLALVRGGAMGTSVPSPRR